MRSELLDYGEFVDGGLNPANVGSDLMRLLPSVFRRDSATQRNDATIYRDAYAGALHLRVVQQLEFYRYFYLSIVGYLAWGAF